MAENKKRCVTNTCTSSSALSVRLHLTSGCYHEQTFWLKHEYSQWELSQCYLHGWDCKTVKHPRFSICIPWIRGWGSTVCTFQTPKSKSDEIQHSLTAHLLHVDSGHCQGSPTLKLSLDLFGFEWTRKEEYQIPPNSCLKQIRGWLGIFWNDFQNHTWNQTNSKFLRHFTQGHKSDASLHAACMLQAPLLGSMAPAWPAVFSILVKLCYESKFCWDCNKVPNS